VLKISRRTLLVAGTAVAAGLVEGQMTKAKNSDVDGDLTEYDVATNGISLHVTEQAKGRPFFSATDFRILPIRGADR
jgi:hypothetical protein